MEEKGNENENRRTKEGGIHLSSTALLKDIKKRRCVNCGKKLNVLEGFHHPTLGKDVLLCGECFDMVWDSEARWGRFVIWNSFNPDSPDPSYTDMVPYPYPKKMKMIRRK